MLFVILFIFELGILSYTALSIQKYLLYTSSKKSFFSVIRYWIFILLFLPGTFIHELSHFVFALLIGVKVNSFTIFPKFEDNRIILGSVQVYESDFIRRFIVGIAPLIVGIFSLLTLVNYYISNRNDLSVYWQIALLFIVFQIANTMFLSKEDLKGSWKILLFFIVLMLAILSLNYFFELNFIRGIAFDPTLIKFSLLLISIPILINLAVISLLKLLLRN